MRRREKALEAGFIERDRDKAFECVKEIININANEGVLFRFRPPKGYEIDTLEAEQIFLCKPSVYEDSSDCEILFDLRDLCEYFMLERRTELLNRMETAFDDKFYNDVIEQLNKNARFENLRNKIRDQALVACFSERYDEFMWKNYALDSEGICLVYNLNDIFLSLPSELKFYPVRYVDNRKKQKDIWFTSKEYNFEDNSEPEYLKFLFSCLTKERIPYSSEAEWRLFSDFSELEEGENGKKFDFLVKPRAIVMGRNIERNLDFRDRVREYSSKSGIRLLKAQDIKK